MSTLYHNLASGTITDNPLSNVATTINSANFVILPTVTAPDTLRLTLDPDGVSGLPEIVLVTAHTAAATSVTVTRGQETANGGAAAHSHPVNTVWRHAVTRQDLVDIIGLVPAGTVRATVNTTADPGWLLFNQAVSNAQTLYPSLWAVAPAAWKSGSTLNLPDLANKVIEGAGATANGATGGSNTKVIGTANLPPHTHTGPSHTHDVNPASTSVSITDPQHRHSNAEMFDQGVTTGMTIHMDTSGTSTMTNRTPTSLASTGITATVDIPNTTSTPAGTGATGDGGFANTALDVTPAHLALTYQIKAH